MTLERQKIVDTAREWLGTRYHHQASRKGVGCDCLGLLRGVALDLGFRFEYTLPNYSPSWAEAAKEETMLEAAHKYLVHCPDGELKAGRVLVFRMRETKIAKHCGIMSVDTPGGEQFIHAYQGMKEGVREVYLVDYWRDRIAGVFEFPGVV